MISKITISLVVAIAILIEKSLQYQCANYTCGDLKSGVCEIRDTHTKEDLKYILQECPHYEECDFKEPKDEVKCIDKRPQTVRAYPGGKCEVDKDCVYGGCLKDTKKCKALDAGAKCSQTRECNFGLVCLDVCTALKGKDAQCSSDSECQRNFGCFNGKCTEYFSQANGANIGQATAYMCQSGFAVQGTCMSLKNKDTILSGCDPQYPCNYTDSTGAEKKFNTCECGYGRIGQTQCQLGNENNDHFTNVINYMKELLTADNIKDCNADEPRFEYCAEYVRNNWDIKKKIIKIQREEIYSSNAHLLKDSEICVQKAVFKWDDTPPEPRQRQCASYKCEGVTLDTSSCAYSDNPFNEDGKGAVVYLNKVCGSEEKCTYTPDLVYGNWTTNSTCLEINVAENDRDKYPGETCKSHKECLKSKSTEDQYKDVGFCVDGRCTGHTEQQNCTAHADCLAGHFCNGLKCEKQKQLGQFCIDLFDCANHLGCLNNTCTEWYSLKNATYLNEENPQPMFCEFGEMNEETRQCAQLAYKNQTGNSDGFITCNLGDTCFYTTGYYKDGENTTVTKDCECGYNTEGQAYCPIPNSLRADDYRNSFKTSVKKLQNKCHTLARGQCEEEYTVAMVQERNKAKVNAEHAHLYYKAVPCASVLSSSFIYTSSLVIFMIIAALF